MSVSYTKKAIRVANVTEGTHTYYVKKSQSGKIDATINKITIVGLPTCTNSLIVYYLDNQGEYRSFVFSKYYELTQDVTESETTREKLPNTISGYSDIRPTKAKVERKIKATAESVTKEQMELLAQLAYSPRIFLKIGDTYDESSFVLVTCSADSSIFQTKRNFTNFSCTFTLPTFNTIG